MMFKYKEELLSNHQFEFEFMEERHNPFYILGSAINPVTTTSMNFDQIQIITKELIFHSDGSITFKSDDGTLGTGVNMLLSGSCGINDIETNKILKRFFSIKDNKFEIVLNAATILKMVSEIGELLLLSESDATIKNELDRLQVLIKLKKLKGEGIINNDTTI